MKIPVLRIELYKKSSGNDSEGYLYQTTPIILDDISYVKVSYGIEKRKDTINLTIGNVRKVSSNNTSTFRITDSNLFQERDIIKVYAYNNPMVGTLDDNLLLIGYIKGWDYNSTGSVGAITINCYNRTEVLLNSFMFAPYNDPAKVPYMILDSMSKITVFNTNDRIYAYKDYSGTSTPGTRGAYLASGSDASSEYSGLGYIRAYKKAAYNEDGTIKWATIPNEYEENGDHKYYFNDVAFAEEYKPFIETLEQLSKPDFTGDTRAGTYINFVDNDNNLHWTAKSFDLPTSLSNPLIKDPRYTIRESSSTNFVISRDVDDVINALIINCGTDPTESGILALAFNARSMGLYGARWKYVAKTDIAESIRKKEKESGVYRNSSENIDVSGTPNSPKYIADDNYPSSFNWTIQTSGSDINGGWEYIANSTTVTSKPAYLDYFRRVAQRMGEKIGKGITDYGDKPKNAGSIEFIPGNNDYVVGNIIKIIIPSMNINDVDNVKLRIMNIVHNFQDGKWNTTLQIEEDLDTKLAG